MADVPKTISSLQNILPSYVQSISSFEKDNVIEKNENFIFYHGKLKASGQEILIKESTIQQTNKIFESQYAREVYILSF